MPTPLIRLRFSTERRSLISWLIRVRTTCKQSHVEFEFMDGSTFGARFSLIGKIARYFLAHFPLRLRRFIHWRILRWIMLLRNRDGVQFRPTSANRHQSAVIHATFLGIEQAFDWCVYNLHKHPYDLLAILGILFGTGWYSKSKEFCSDTIDQGAEFGVTPPFIFINNSAWATTPRDLLTTVNPGFTILDAEEGALACHS